MNISNPVSHGILNEAIGQLRVAIGCVTSACCGHRAWQGRDCRADPSDAAA
jgi:hypothetical protein